MKFNCGEATAWRSVRRVVETVYFYRNFYIKWDTEQEMRRIAAMILGEYGLPDVNGMVDGTHIEVPVPVIDAVAWINPKGFASIQTQVNICEIDTIFLISTKCNSLFRWFVITYYDSCTALRDFLDLWTTCV